MNSHLKQILIFVQILGLMPLTYYAQQNGSPSQESSRSFPLIRQASENLGTALCSGDLKTTISLHLPESFVLPEYHFALESKSEIKNYYDKFFTLSSCHLYEKDILEIQQFGSYYLELGTFTHRYRIPSEEEVSYQGKYMTLWTTFTEGQFKVLANIWGSSSWIDAKKLHFFDVEGNKGAPISPKTQLQKDIYRQVNFVKDAVQTGNAQKQLTTYLEDAIYMTYNDPPFIGKKAIGDYFESHYSPSDSRDSLSILPYRIIDMGAHVMTMGKYYVGWKQEEDSYYIRGKNLNLYRKMEDGSLKIYRQMVNHSIAPTLVSTSP